MSVLTENKSKQFDVKDYKNKSVCHMFRKSVERFPERTALFFEGTKLTYQRLDIITDNIALYLRKKGVKPNSIVALQVGPSIDMIIGIMSILKAGGAYLPITSSYPSKRIVSILEDCNPALVITKEKDFDNYVKEHIKCPVLYLDQYKDFSRINYNLEIISNPSDLSYVIYTSGSTGSPKGVMIEHRNVINLVNGLHEDIYKNYDTHLNIALIAPMVFDASVQQIFASLLLGHTLYIVPEEIRADGNQLISYFIRHNINISDGTPSHIKILQHSIRNKMPVGHFIIGGEPFTVTNVEGFFNKFEGCSTKITNIYGITECCVDSTSYLISPNEIYESNTIPIGKPLKNTQIYILDEKLNIVPSGTTGEIYISGDGVGRGYINLPHMTEEKFITNPFLKGKVMYKTGDLGKQRQDGNIEMLGRIDSQVKIKGHRIELEEIQNKIVMFLRQRGNGNVIQCNSCFLTNQYPDLTFNEQGECQVCLDYADFKPHLDEYFGIKEDIRKLFEKNSKNKKSQYDCLLLYSGGKDSSYVLYKLIDMGLNVLTFTFDNGYISDTAFKNIQKITEHLGVDNVIMKLDNMDELFLEELKIDNTVCNSCFRALTYLSTKLAYEKGINVIVTGLSRGQIIDTKLYGLYKMGITNPKQIEEKLLLYRKMYHSMQDTMNIEPIADESYFDDTYFVDYFRFDNVTTEEIKRYLKEKNKDFWQKPADTGFCSTNCLVNDVGIYTHLKNRNFHNYASPLSWQYRLGLNNFEEIVMELEGNINEEHVSSIYRKIGYDCSSVNSSDIIVAVKGDENYEKAICAYLVGESKYNIDELKEYLRAEIPHYMIPSYFIKIKKVPLTINGKLDLNSLPNPLGNDAVKTLNSVDDYDEDKLIRIWKNIIQIDSINLDDNFFELGGDSFKANILISKIYEEFEVEMPLLTIYENPTIKAILKNLKLKKENILNIENDHIILIKKGNTAKNIFIVHDVIGQVDSFKELCRGLSDDFNYIGIKPIKNKTYEYAGFTIEKIAEEYIKSIKKIQCSGPYYLLGWSFGGMLTYELVNQLERENKEIKLVGIIDSEIPGSSVWLRERDMLISSFNNISRLIDPNWNSINDSISLVAFIKNALQYNKINRDILKEYIPDFIRNIIPNFEQCSLSLRCEYLDLIARHINALTLYKPNKLNSDIHFFNAKIKGNTKQSVKWSLFTDGKVSYYDLEENHFSILRNSNLVKQINKLLKYQ